MTRFFPKNRARIGKNAFLLAFLQKRQLNILCRLLFFFLFAADNEHRRELLFGDNHTPDCAGVGRERFKPVYVHICAFDPVAKSEIHRILQHCITVFYQRVAKLSCDALFFFFLYRQIKKHYKSHKFTHTRDNLIRLSTETIIRLFLRNNRLYFRPFVRRRLRGCEPRRR